MGGQRAVVVGGIVEKRNTIPARSWRNAGTAGRCQAERMKGWRRWEPSDE